MFPRRMSLLEVRKSCRLVSSSMSNATTEYIAVHGECSPHNRDSSLYLLVMVFVSSDVSLSQVDVVFNVLYLNIVVIGVSFSIVTFVLKNVIFRQ